VPVYNVLVVYCRSVIVCASTTDLTDHAVAVLCNSNTVLYKHSFVMLVAIDDILSAAATVLLVVAYSTFLSRHTLL
jgi:hypothetical protein